MIDRIETVSSWDEYYYGICVAVARNSKCFSRQIGAILVKDKNIISTGYNGPPRNFPRCDERWNYDKHLRKEYCDRFKVIEKEFKHKMRLGKFFGKCPRQVLGFESGEGVGWCVAAHAEENCILNAARMGICTKDTKMYMSCGIPCSKCLIKIIQAGIVEMAVSHFEWYGTLDASTKYLLNNSGLKLRKFNFLEKK